MVSLPSVSNISLDSRNRLEINYLDWYCKQSKVWDELKNTARGMGARRDSVSPDRFLALKIPLPPVREQRRIVARIDELAAKINEAWRPPRGSSGGGGGALGARGEHGSRYRYA